MLIYIYICIHNLLGDKGVCWGYMGIMEQTTEATTLQECIYWVYNKELLHRVSLGIVLPCSLRAPKP